MNTSILLKNKEWTLLLGFFLFSATLFGVPSNEFNFTVDEYGKRHYVLVPENTNTGFLEKLSTIVSGRYSSEHKIFDYDELTIDSESLLSFPSVSSLLFFEPGPNGTGTADLIKTGIGGTAFGEGLPDYPKFLELNDGIQTLTPIVQGNSIVYYYSSTEQGFEVFNVLSSGKHLLDGSLVLFAFFALAAVFASPYLRQKILLFNLLVNIWRFELESVCRQKPSSIPSRFKHLLVVLQPPKKIKSVFLVFPLVSFLFYKYDNYNPKINYKKPFVYFSIVILLSSLTIFPTIEPVYADGGDAWCDISSTICDSSWENRFEIIIDALEVSDADTADFTNFPIMFNVTGTTFTDNLDDGADTLEDIRFTNQGGTVLLDYEIQLYDKTGNEMIAWVEVPTLDYNDDTTIYMYYDNAGSPTDQSDDAGTWSNGYVAVWHMEEGDVVDSSGTVSDGTNNGSTDDTTGVVEDEREFNGSSQWIDLGDTTNLDGATVMTLEAWIDVDAWGGDAIMRKWAGGGQSYFIGLSGSDEIQFVVSDGSNQLNTVTTNANLSTATRYHVVVVWDGGNTRKFIIDGTTEPAADSNICLVCDL